MHFSRKIKENVIAGLAEKKVLILYGPRQVGKTTLVKEVLAAEVKNSVYLSCDEPDVREAFTNKTSTEMHAFLRGASTVVLDEAQRVPNIGLALKLLHDTYPALTIIATGSSSFELADSASEPLTGRNRTYTLLPISYTEFADTVGYREALRLLEETIRYGLYPAVLNAADKEREVTDIARDYLFRDVLRVDRVRKPMVIEKLMQLLAYQIGNEVSYNEIAQRLEISRPTVLQYVRILEQAFVLFRVSAFGKNPRNEITRFDKIYFYDTGIRNALIGDFASMATRPDAGALFENFFVVERMKLAGVANKKHEINFWRTKDGSEVDFVETIGNVTRAFECKWGNGKVNRRAWQNNYPTIPLIPITKDTVEPWLVSLEGAPLQ